MPLGSYPQPTRVVQHLYDKATEKLLRSYPVKELPVHVRPVSLFPSVSGALCPLKLIKREWYL